MQYPFFYKKLSKYLGSEILFNLKLLVSKVSQPILAQCSIPVSPENVTKKRFSDVFRGYSNEDWA